MIVQYRKEGVGPAPTYFELSTLMRSSRLLPADQIPQRRMSSKATIVNIKRTVTNEVCQSRNNLSNNKSEH